MTKTVLLLCITGVHQIISISIELASIDNEKERHTAHGTDKQGSDRRSRSNGGGAVVRALRASNQFKVRALTRNPAEHRTLANEVVEADLNRPEPLSLHLQGRMAYFW